MNHLPIPRGVDFTRDLISTLADGHTLGDAVTVISTEFADRLDNPSWLLRYVMGRLPAANDPLLKLKGKAPESERLRIMFRHPGYGRALGSRIMNAFPERQRMHFLHVPKTGGSTINAALRRSKTFIPVPSATVTHLDPSPANIDRYLQHAARGLAEPSARFYLLGHPNARQLIEGKLVRACDTVFTVVRGSDDLFESYLNYIIDLFERYAAGKMSFDGMRVWYQQLGLQETEQVTPEQILGMVDRIIAKIMISAPICASLGANTAATAIDMMRRVDGKVYPLRSLDHALAALGLEAGPPENTSKRRFRVSDFDAATRQRVSEFMAEDAKVMDILEGCGLHTEGQYYMLDRAQA